MQAMVSAGKVGHTQFLKVYMCICTQSNRRHADLMMSWRRQARVSCSGALTRKWLLLHLHAPLSWLLGGTVHQRLTYACYVTRI